MLAAVIASLPQIYLARHGQTAWSLSGQHTGRTDIPLTADGENEARNLAGWLAGKHFARVWTSPSSRARVTCEIAGFARTARVDPDLAEWDYGDYEGLRSGEIQARQPGWEVFRHGGPNGESPADVAARADRVIQRLRSVDGNALVFSSGHFLRALAARWLGLEVSFGKFFRLDTGSISILGYEHAIAEPVVARWNQKPAS